jgi:hypothetical protein
MLDVLLLGEPTGDGDQAVVEVVVINELLGEADPALVHVHAHLPSGAGGEAVGLDGHFLGHDFLRL